MKKDGLTILKPHDLYCTMEQFFKMVNECEQEWFQENKGKETYVQYWVSISPRMVNPKYIELLKESYTEAGWDNVEVKWMNDRTTSLMVYLHMNN